MLLACCVMRGQANANGTFCALQSKSCTTPDLEYAEWLHDINSPMNKSQIHQRLAAVLCGALQSTEFAGSRLHHDNVTHLVYVLVSQHCRPARVRHPDGRRWARGRSTRAEGQGNNGMAGIPLRNYTVHQMSVVWTSTLHYTML